MGKKEESVRSERSSLLIIAVVFVVQLLSYTQLFVTPWVVACQAPLSMGFPRQEPWSWFLSFPSPGDIVTPGIKPTPSALAGRFLPWNHQGNPQEWPQFKFNGSKL